MDWNMQKKIKVGRQSRRDHVKGGRRFPREVAASSYFAIGMGGDRSFHFLGSFHRRSHRLRSDFQFPTTPIAASLNNRIKQNTLIPQIGSYLEAMSKRISLTKLTKKVEESKAATLSSKGMVIKEKGPRDEVPDSSPRKKVKNNESKGKETIPPPEAKKLKPSKAASRETLRLVAPEEGHLKKPDEVLGSGAFVMANAAVAEKIFAWVILPANKERVDKLSLNQVVTKFLHILGQVSVHFYPRIQLHTFTI
ncbi:uncharacterized protein LOC130753365 [Actinidia eriantha]|uniref:uncharacterized protein LOC130753365 n=1 Tax=Actinidia eriantha TaxID=165200 RepID=UPI00258AB224|nr:uncharacterized protein LOC130753365 [Actinidia eriantha]